MIKDFFVHVVTLILILISILFLVSGFNNLLLGIFSLGKSANPFIGALNFIIGILFGYLSQKSYIIKSKPKKKLIRSQKSLLNNIKIKTHKDILILNNRDDLSNDEKVTKIILMFSSICSAIAIQPIPFADFFVLTPIQAYMGKKIADIRGYKISEEDTNIVFKEIASLIGLGILAQQIAIGSYKIFLPFFGAITTIPLVFGLTYGIGNVMDYYFLKKVNGETPDKERMKNIFYTSKTKGIRKAKEKKEIIKDLKKEINNNL